MHRLTRWERQSLFWLFLFFLGGAAYGFVEIAWRGFTHFTMLPVGGLCAVMLAVLSRLRAPLWVQALWGTAIITGVELAVGCVLNLHLGLRVWDYSKEAFHLWGQICPRFSFYWFLLSGAALLFFRVVSLCYGVAIAHAAQTPGPTSPEH